MFLHLHLILTLILRPKRIRGLDGLVKYVVASQRKIWKRGLLRINVHNVNEEFNFGGRGSGRKTTHFEALGFD